MLVWSLEPIFENTRKDQGAILGRLWYIVSWHSTHQACNQQAGLQLQVAGDKPGGWGNVALPITSCGFKKRKGNKRGNVLTPWSSQRLLQIISTGGPRDEHGLIARPPSPFSLRPESLFARPVLPSRPIEEHRHAVTVQK